MLSDARSFWSPLRFKTLASSDLLGGTSCTDTHIRQRQQPSVAILSSQALLRIRQILY